MTPVGIAFLVVEDHPLIGTTIQRALSRHGQAELVETRAQAIARIHDGAFDGVVADVGLPDGSGFDVVRELNRLAPNVPVLILSGEVDHGRLREADAHDATYLLKPPAMSDLDRFATRVKAAASDPAQKGNWPCHSKFFLAEYKLEHGDTAGARRYLQEVTPATCADGAAAAAAAELRRLPAN